jgi:hypothetical protein
MNEYCPETVIEFDALRLSSAHKLKSAECYCSRATLDELLSDEVMAPVLRCISKRSRSQTIRSGGFSKARA